MSVGEGLELGGLRAESPAFEEPSITASFTELIAAENAEAFVRVEPAVKFAVEPYEDWRGDGCLLRGAFAPGAIYTVTFKAGLKSVNDLVLARDVRRTVQMPDRPATIAFTSPGHYLSPAGSLRIPLAAVNVEKVAVQARPVLPQNLLQYVLREDGRYARFYGWSPEDHANLLTGDAVARTVAVKRVLNREQRLDVDLRAYAAGEPSGAYLISARAGSADEAHQLVAVTDLGLAAREAADGVLVWVNSLREASPRGGAVVQLFGVNGEELARGTTADDGTVFLREPVGRTVEPMLVVAQRGRDLSFLKLSTTRQELPPGGTKAYLSGAYEAAVFTDRGIYRPGETIHLRALVRDRALACPAPFPVVFRIVQPDGQVHRRLPAMLDAQGAAGADCELPAFIGTGAYRIELAMPGTETPIGTARVSVEDFVPPQIRVALQGPEGRQAAGGEVELRTRADHLFGRPAAGLPAFVTIEIEAAGFAPTNWPGYVFGDPEKSFARSQRVLPRALLDAEGAAVFTTALGDANLRPPAALRVVAGATVTESSGRAVTAYRAMPVDAYPFYIGLRRGDAGAVEVGSTQRVAAIVVSPAGTPDPGPRPLRATWSSVHHATALKRGPDGRYTFQAERTLKKLHEQLVNVAGAQPAQLAFAPPAAGEYLLVVDDPASGASTSLRYTAASRGDSWVSWSRERPDLVTLEPDRERYRPGDLARITVKAPFAGTALMTIESDRIRLQRVLTLTGTTAVLEVPLRAEDAPNVYCTLTLLRPAVAEDVWTAHRAAGAALLRVEPPGHRLTARVEAPESARPAAPLEAVIRLVDADGKPVAGDCVVAAVDEAICMLTDFKTPDPMDDFLADRFAGVVPYDFYGLLMPIWDDEAALAGSRPAGDGSGSLRRRLNPINARRFKPVALWQAGVRTDTNGEARVRFDLPEFAGELRVMAVAWNRQQAGSGQATVKVKRPLIAQSSLPRFLAPGDRAEATVQVFNESSNEVTAILRVTAGGPLQVEQPERTLRLAAGASATERVAVRAGAEAGVAVVTIETSAGAEAIRETIELAVRPARAAEVAAAVGRIAAGEHAAFAPPTNWLAASQTVRVSARPDVRLGRALDYLLRYPYGCLEQTVSASLPLLHLPDLAHGAIGREETRRFVQAGILRVLRMQQPDGLFAMWPGARAQQQWAGIYATHFLVESGRAGYEVPADRLAAALAGLHARLELATHPEPDADAWRDDLEQRAFICQVLARAGQPDRAWTARLDELADRLSPGARAHLAVAQLSAGEPRRARALLASAPNPDLSDRRRGDLLRSGVRDAALLLAAWVDHDPAAPAAAALAEQLLGTLRDGHWGTTQDDAWVLMALGAYAARQPDTPASFRATAEAGGKSIPVPAAGLTLTNIGPCVVRNEGPGDVYVLAQSEGVPASGLEKEVDAGLRVAREWLDLEGAPLPDRTLSQGDLVVVRLTVDTLGEPLSDIVIEDLLPAGLEIENPALAVSQQRPAWLKDKMDWCAAQSARDDRMLVFSGAASGPHHFHYLARAVTPGRFVLPPVTASGMYEPGRRSVRGAGELVVKP